MGTIIKASGLACQAPTKSKRSIAIVAVVIPQPKQLIWKNEWMGQEMVISILETAFKTIDTKIYPQKIEVSLFALR